MFVALRHGFIPNDVFFFVHAHSEAQFSLAKDAKIAKKGRVFHAVLGELGVLGERARLLNVILYRPGMLELCKILR